MFMCIDLQKRCCFSLTDAWAHCEYRDTIVMVKDENHWKFYLSAVCVYTDDCKGLRKGGAGGVSWSMSEPMPWQMRMNASVWKSIAKMFANTNISKPDDRGDHTRDSKLENGIVAFNFTFVNFVPLTYHRLNECVRFVAFDVCSWKT